MINYLSPDRKVQPQKIGCSQSRKDFRHYSHQHRWIAPSILAADFSCLGEEMLQAEQAGISIFHLDIMDGHFVPNLSFGPPVIQAIRPLSPGLFDVHLMISHPLDYILPFQQAGADHITFHVESNDDGGKVIKKIRESGCSVGICLKPGTKAEAILPYIDMVDLILVMTVEPGFGGQSFLPEMTQKIQRIRQWIEEQKHPIHLQVDGGITESTAKISLEAGANVLVVGTSIFHHRQGMNQGVQTFQSLLGVS